MAPTIQAWLDRRDLNTFGKQKRVCLIKNNNTYVDDKTMGSKAA